MKLWRVMSGRHLWGAAVVAGLAMLAACGGGVLTNLTSLPASPTIVSDSGGTGLFAIRKAGTVTIYVSFANFVTALQGQLNGSTVMTGLFARGGYDAGSNTFTVQRMAVNLR